MQKQVAIAGYRLADLLEFIFHEAPPADEQQAAAAVAAGHAVRFKVQSYRD